MRCGAPPPATNATPPSSPTSMLRGRSSACASAQPAPSLASSTARSRAFAQRQLERHSSRSYPAFSNSFKNSASPRGVRSGGSTMHMSVMPADQVSKRSGLCCAHSTGLSAWAMSDLDRWGLSVGRTYCQGGG